MALTTGSTVLASDINALKARVKAEMNRRAHTGSLTGYASSSYDFSTVPGTGVRILAEHHNKIVTPMRAVNSTTTNRGDVSSGTTIV